MAVKPKLPPYSTGDKASAGHDTARKRWPVILTGAIDDVHREISRLTDEDKRSEGKRIVEDLAKLKYEIQHDRVLTPLPDDGKADVDAYNSELKGLGPPSWLNAPWLFSECYLYRRLSTLFELSNHWKSYDVFNRQKMSTFRSSRPAVLELAAKYKELEGKPHVRSSGGLPNPQQSDEQAEALLFAEMCEICLWGNATDLSLLTSLTYDDIQKLQGSDARKKAEKNILVNDLPKVFGHLIAARSRADGKERRIDIVLDNSGFELFVDLFLAAYLLSTDLATQVVLHPKSIPWFVSDVQPKDFAALLSALADPQAFYSTPSDEDKHASRVPQPLSDTEIDEISYLFQSWSKFHQEGKMIIRPNLFWTQGGSFWDLPEADSRLFADLKESLLVIFKGDLNYRKLTADVSWDSTTSFAEALGPLGPGSGISILALRTCKADVVVGLRPGQDEELRASDGGQDENGGRKWAWHGKWAVVQFCDGT